MLTFLLSESTGQPVNRTLACWCTRDARCHMRPGHACMAESSEAAWPDVFVLWHGTAVSCLLSRCNRHIGRGRTRPGPQSQRLADKSQQAPEIREDCEKNECKEPAKHFQHCSEKVWHHLGLANDEY